MGTKEKEPEQYDFSGNYMQFDEAVYKEVPCAAVSEEQNPGTNKPCGNSTP